MLDPLAKQAIRNTFKNKTVLLIVVLGILTFLQALAVVYVKVHYREQYVHYQTLVKDQNHLKAEWAQLLIEEGTWGSAAKIESAAQQYLNMQAPKPQDTRILRP